MAGDRTTFLRASTVNVIANLLKIVVEGTLGILSGSIALTADAAHSVADLLASGVVLVWGRVVYDDPDRSHPHGHDRIEPLAALFVGIVLVLLGFKLLSDAIHALRVGSTASYGPILLGGLAFAFLDMGLCYWYTQRVNRELDSPGLRALAADSRNDLYTTGAAMVGVGGMALGYPLFDPIAGGVVSVLVVYQGFDICRENVHYLADSAPPDALQARIRETILAHPDVHGTHDFVAYYSGQTIEVEFHAEIDSDYSLVEAHEIETELRNRVRAIDPVADVHIHLDPAGLGEWEDAADGV